MLRKGIGISNTVEYVCLESLVPENYLLWKIEKTVDLSIGYMILREQWETLH